MTTNAFHVERVSAAPGGVSTVSDRPVIYRRALKMRVTNFMLEDVVDGAAARTALAEGGRVSWKVAKEQLGL